MYTVGNPTKASFSQREAAVSWKQGREGGSHSADIWVSGFWKPAAQTQSLTSVSIDSGANELDQRFKPH